ncbi:MAG TPA: hypothetical protein VIN73_06210 [Vicingaceae bacterium]
MFGLRKMHGMANTPQAWTLAAAEASNYGKVKYITTMILKNIFCLIIVLVTVTGCVSTKSISSYNDKTYFKESPKIVSYKDRYFLRFVYPDNTFAFFMMCESKINADTLIYYLPVTTSSGNLRGKIQFQEIFKANEIEIIKKKNVYWEEPDGSLVVMPLRCRKRPRLW